MNEFHKWRRGYGDFSPHWCVTDLEEAWYAATAAQREPMPCGHPAACVVSSELERNAHNGTSWCGWCASLDEARHDEQARCVTVAHLMPIEKLSQTMIDELDFVAGPLYDEGEAWAYYHAERIAQAIDATCKEAVTALPAKAGSF